MVSTAEFTEAIDILTRDPTSAQAKQTLHILMTGGPAATPAAAAAAVKAMCETMATLLTP